MFSKSRNFPLYKFNLVILYLKNGKVAIGIFKNFSFFPFSPKYYKLQCIFTIIQKIIACNRAFLIENSNNALAIPLFFVIMKGGRSTFAFDA